MSSFFPRATAINKFPFRLINKGTAAPVTTGTVTVLITKDGGAQVASTNTAVHNGNGEWTIDLTAAERDAKITSLTVNHADIVPIHITLVSDDQLGPGSNQINLQFGSNGKFASIWLTTQADASTVIASGETDNNGNITFYLDTGTYYLYFQKAGVNFKTYGLTVAGAATVNLAAYVTVATSFLATTAYASESVAQTYFDTRLNTENWDNANSLDRQKALLMATRAINRLSFQGDATVDALDAGNQFPRGWDTEVPEDIVWATCEEALALLGSKDVEQESDSLRILSEKYSGVTVHYDADYHPENIRSGIMSKEAWNFLTPYLRDRRHFQIYRV